MSVYYGVLFRIEELNRMRFLSCNEQAFVSGGLNDWSTIGIVTGVGTASGTLVGVGLAIYKKDIRALLISIAFGAIAGFFTIPYLQAAANG